MKRTQATTKTTPELGWPGPNARPIGISHQGDGHVSLRPCSLEAFQAAYVLGLRHFETDLRETADNTLVAIHDVDDQVKGRLIRTMTRAELERALGFQLVDINQLTASFPDAFWNFEVKAQADATTLSRWIANHQSSARRICVSWGPTISVANRTRAALLPDQHNAASILELNLRFIAAVLTLGRWSRPTKYSCAQYHHLIVRRCVVKSLHRSGVAVHAWGVSKEARMQRMLNVGVNGIITSETQKVIEALNTQIGRGSSIEPGSSKVPYSKAVG